MESDEAAFLSDEFTFGDFLAHGSNFGASIVNARLADFRLTICSFSESSLSLLDAENLEEDPESELLTLRFVLFLGSAPFTSFLAFFSVFAPSLVVAFLDAAGTVTYMTVLTELASYTFLV